jgi:hypothetical protein
LENFLKKYEKKSFLFIRQCLTSSHRQRDLTNQPTNNMTTTNAAKKLTKAGFTVSEIKGSFQASHPATAYIIEYIRNGGSDNIICINVRTTNDKDDSMTDYFAGTWVDNITQAIRLAI